MDKLDMWKNIKIQFLDGGMRVWYMGNGKIKFFITIRYLWKRLEEKNVNFGVLNLLKKKRVCTLLLENWEAGHPLLFIRSGSGRAAFPLRLFPGPKRISLCDAFLIASRLERIEKVEPGRETEEKDKTNQSNLFASSKCIGGFQDFGDFYSFNKI